MAEVLMPDDGVTMSDLAAELYPDETNAVVRRRRLQAVMRRRNIESQGPFIDERGFPVRWLSAADAEEIRRPGTRGRPRNQ